MRITSRGIKLLNFCGRQVMLSVLLLLSSSPITILMCHAFSSPLLSPEVTSVHNHPQLTFLYHNAHTSTIGERGLPAKQGTNFEGPDPGLNAAIITVPEVCPSNYMKDNRGRCRPAFTYGPNPLSTFSPEKYKGSLQFYMGLQIGRRGPHRRRNRLGGRLRNRIRASTPPPGPSEATGLSADNLPSPPLPPPVGASLDSLNLVSDVNLLPTPPTLTETVAEIKAILESLNRRNSKDGPAPGPSLPDTSDIPPLDDDDD